MTFTSESGPPTKKGPQLVSYGPMQNLEDPEYLDSSPTSPQEDRDVSFAKSLLQTNHGKAPSWYS